MGLSIDPEVRGRIFAFADENLSSPAILKRLKKQNVKVSERTIRRVLQNRRQTQEAGGNAPQQLRKQRSDIWRTPANVAKVKNFVDQDDPLPQNEIGRRLGTTRWTIGRTAKKDLGYIRKKKANGRYLCAPQIRKRKDRALGMAQLVEGEKKKMILTIDEAWLPMDYSNRETTTFRERNAKGCRKSPLQQLNPGFLEK